jgi:hypothetical protein
MGIDWHSLLLEKTIGFAFAKPIVFYAIFLLLENYCNRLIDPGLPTQRIGILQNVLQSLTT